ncbi:MAG: hypothetical protein KA821_11070 [Chitinophagaceae bacterium]|nr:hypothetical protein [Chitinophagaceae bacterium]
MKVKWIVLLAMFFSLRSCDMREDDLKIIEATGLDSNNLRLNSMFLCNSDTGFIVGSLDQVTHNPDQNSDTFSFVNRTALLYKTIDGGKSWIGKNFGRGSLINIVQHNTSLFTFKTSENYLDYSTYSSNDLGDTWSKEDAFPQRISNLFFSDSSYIAITSDSLENKSYINVSKNFGKSWTVIESPFPIYDVIMKDGKLIFLSSNAGKGDKKNILVEFGMQDSSVIYFDLPNGFDCNFLTNFDNKVKLIGIKEGHLTIYSFIGNRFKFEYSYPQDVSFFPGGYYSNNGTEWIVVGKREGTDVSYRLLKTGDNGRSWEIVNFKREKYIEPFYFLNVNGKMNAWFYTGSGRFQVFR